MSSLYTRSKEYTRSRKAQSDSPPSSPSPIAKTLRVSSLFLSVLQGDPLGERSRRWWFVVLPLETCVWGLFWKEDRLNETWEGASVATGFKKAANSWSPRAAMICTAGCRGWCDGSFPPALLAVGRNIPLQQPGATRKRLR